MCTYVGHNRVWNIHDCSERFNGNHKCFIIFIGYVSNVNFIASMNLYAVKCMHLHLPYYNIIRGASGAGKWYYYVTINKKKKY